MTKVAELQHDSIRSMRELLSMQPGVTVDDKDAAARLAVLTIESVVHQAMAAPRTLDADVLRSELVAMLTRYLTSGVPQPPVR
jgi:hypothetical protein